MERYFKEQPLIMQSHCMESVQIRSFLWSVSSCIQTEYEDSKYSYSVGIQENTDQKNSVFGHFSCSEQLKVWKFQVSNGWFYVWNSRCNTLFKKVTGQSESVAPKMAASWKEMSLGWKE